MKLQQLIPVLLVEDMSKTLRFYEEILGFRREILFPEKNPIFAQIGRDEIQIMLYVRSEFEKEIPKLAKINMGGTVALYIKADEIEDLYQKISQKVSVIQKLHQTDYGSFEFTIEDRNGYLIYFSQTT